MRLSLVVNEAYCRYPRMKNQQKIKSVTEWYGCGKCGAMDKNVECLCCHEVETMEYFELLGMRYGDTNAVTLRV